ncbi:tetratricopeptide repeat protein [Xanthocytophaga flava]|uniref:tetratricopeptide repeat protein n=1 Tax=Xanthocytophaga flava TaxID=3048013 RepID=UPI0028D05988|nr:ABC transporter substrate-binding protein [Xanthocytophaga flavus]MDJ1469875.1 ABC transporter substrate-binding protein [Xanthocytophaga flavus]
MIRLSQKYYFFVIIFSFLLSPVQAQILQDNEVQQWIHEGLDKMYNFEFAEANPIFEKIRQRYPQHPVYPMLKSLETTWKNIPIGENKNVIATHRAYLNEVIKRAEVLLDKNDKDPEGVFFAMAAHGFLALSHSESDEMTSAVNEARKTYGHLKDGMKMLNQYADFYSPVGVYNYYVVKYPETHPVVKPFMIFFADGDKALGLKQLEIGSQKGIFTKVEALFFLLHIYIKHEYQAGKALACTQQLITRYPNNIIFAMRHAEMLLANGRYDEAEPFITQVGQNKDKVFQSTVAVFNGIIQEKQTKNLPQAKIYYLKATTMNALNVRYNNDFLAMAYAGLARIAITEGKKDIAKANYKKCLELAEYDSTIAEAKNYMKKN